MYNRQELEKLQQALDQWEKTTLSRSLKGLPERQEQFITTSSEPIERVYTPLDVGNMDYLQDLGLPGEYPYTRGVQATMYRGKPWTIRQFAGFGSASQTNERFKVLLSHGQTGLSTAFHLPTLYGYDSDHEMSAGEVGKCGVAIDTLRDFEAAAAQAASRRRARRYRPAAGK